MKINKILLDVNESSREDIFTLLANEMEALGIVNNAKEYLQAIEAREAESTTGLVDGFAIPHGKSEAIKESAIIYIRNAKGLEWNSLDGSLITDIFALAIPQEGNHLDDLIEISTKLMDEDICKALRLTNNPEEIIAIFS